MKEWLNEVLTNGKTNAVKFLPKPVLIVVPTTIIHQWTEALARYSPHFHIRLYHGDSRTKTSGVNSKAIHRVLERSEDNVFRFRYPKKPGEKWQGVVIMTGYDTFRARHGPEKLRVFRGTPMAGQG
jgi:SNF2 family DNA or RNA helicase